MKHSKHAAVNKFANKKKLIIIFSIIIIIVSVSLFCFISFHNKNKIISDTNDTSNVVNDVPLNEVTEQVQESFEMVDVSDMPTEKGGFGVLGKIVIDKINVENYILDKTTNASLNLAVTWFWGPDNKNRTVNDIR